MHASNAIKAQIRTRGYEVIVSNWVLSEIAGLFEAEKNRY
jgi:hypothetical protein